MRAATCDLEHLLKTKQLSMVEVISISKDIVEGLMNMHNQLITHCDIKADNVLMFHNKALVADFGLSRSSRLIVYIE
jgi:serine/threonine protein kinase